MGKVTVAARYNSNKLCSYIDESGKPCRVRIVCGPRGNGKTFHFCFIKAVKRYIMRGEQFAYIMRGQNEIQLAVGNNNFFSDSNFLALYPEYEFKSDTKRGYIRKKGDVDEDENEAPWEQICMFIHLSSSTLKGINGSQLGCIIFDEFIPLPGGRYLKEECNRLMELYQTLSRDRDIPLYMLANVVTSASPYFTFFGVAMPAKGKFMCNPKRSCVLENSASPVYTEQMKQTQYALMIKDTKLSKYAIEGESLFDLNTFVKKKHKTMTCEFKLISSSITLYAWESTSNIDICFSMKGNVHVDGYAVDEISHNNTTELIDASSMISKQIQYTYEKGLLSFDSSQAKAEFFANFATIL